MGLAVSYHGTHVAIAGRRVKVGRSTVTFPTGMLGSVRIDALPRDIDPAAPAGRSGEIPPPAHQPDEATHADLAAELLVAVAKGVRGEDQGGYGARERAGTLRWWWDLGRAAEQIGEDERDAVLARMRVAAPSSAASDEGGGVEGVAQPLHVAAHAGDLWSTRALVALGAKVNGKDCSGATPIAQAAFHGHLDVAACLLEANADPKAKDVDGLSAVEWAREMGHAPLAALLQRSSSA
ncbi:ankyrin repeat-containing domain protein [Baffinella frigidus]|nr:ankyrin repeat-containing domain protein [Cryptophyta sp. CCMP2293]